MNPSGGGHLPFFETLSSAGGEAPWLTLVHGASQDHRLFSAQIPVFEQHYRLLLVDLPDFVWVADELEQKTAELAAGADSGRRWISSVGNSGSR